MDIILVEKKRALHLARFAVDRHRHPQRRQRIRERFVELRDRHRHELDRAAIAAARSNVELVNDKVEVDLERFTAVRHASRRETGGGGIERHLPRVVEPRHLRESNLAHDLRPHVQRLVRVLPCGVRQIGPYKLRHDVSPGSDALFSAASPFDRT